MDGSHGLLMSLLLGAAQTPVGGFLNGFSFFLGRVASDLNPSLIHRAPIFPDFADGRDNRAVSYGLIAVIIQPG
jgi:hypothetical protein